MAYMHTHVLILMFVSNYCLAAEYSPPRFRYPNSSHNLYYENGATVNIRCAAEGNPPPTYRWLENDTIVKPSSGVRYNQTTGILEITNFSLRHQMSYRCIATNQYEYLVDPNATKYAGVSVSTISPTIQLWKLWLETFTSQTNIIKNVTEYEYLVLPCVDRKTSATLLLRYVWLDTGTGHNVSMDEGRLYIDQAGSLHFTFVLLSDGRIAGYTCGISAIQSDRFKFVKQDFKYVIRISAATGPKDSAGIKPQFKYSNTVVYGTRLSSATLECVFSGFGPTLYPIQSWLDLKGKASYDNGDKYKISKYGRQMTIHSLTEDDELFYICSARYVNGFQASSAVFLNVTGPPVFKSGPPTDQVGIQNSNVQFICDARSVTGEVPPSPPNWYINGERMETTYDRVKLQLSDDKKVLTVSNLWKHLDVMCVQCQVENNVGTVIASACLYVILPIQILQQPNATQRIKYGGLIDLTVKASTDPSMNLSYRWSFERVTYDEGNIHEFMYFNPQSKEAFINTSKMSLDEYKLMEGKYAITIFHQHESRIVRTEVTLLDKSLKKEVEKSNSPVNIGRDKILLAVLLSLLCILVPAVILVLTLCLRRWTNKNARDEQESEIVEAPKGQPRHGYITDNGSSVDSNETGSDI